jgi:hypothetical protein
MSLIGNIRLGVFIATTLFACIVVALSGHFLSWELGLLGGYSPFAALAIASGALTLFTLPVYAIIDNKRNGAMTSMIIVEMVTITILWVLWVATASLMANTGNVNCNVSDIYYQIPASDLTACHEFQAIEAFSFLSFFSLLIYAFILLVFTMIAHNRGHAVWTSSVKETNFFAPGIVPPEDAEKQAGGMPQQQQPYQYPPNFAPQQQGYAPPPQGFAPPQQGFAPPPQGFTPPPQGFAPPPQQGFAPPQQGFAPPQQSFTPPPQNFAPPQQQPLYPNYTGSSGPPTQGDVKV